MTTKHQHAVRVAFFFILAVLALGAALLPSKFINAPADVTNSQETVAVTIRVNDAAYRIEVPENSTAYDAMLVARDQSDFRFSGENFGEDLGFFVESINEIAPGPDDIRYWIFYVNGKPADVGVSSYTVKNGDVLEWKLEAARE